MKSNVIPITADHVTPSLVLEGVASTIEDIQEIYVVVRTKNDNMQMYGSGDLKGMSDAALYFLRMATNTVIQKQDDDEDESE